MLVTAAIVVHIFVVAIAAAAATVVLATAAVVIAAAVVSVGGAIAATFAFNKTVTTGFSQPTTNQEGIVIDGSSWQLAVVSS